MEQQRKGEMMIENKSLNELQKEYTVLMDKVDELSRRADELEQVIMKARSK